jgi:hypothetical protein
LLEQAVQPGAVDQLGGRDALEEKQGVRLVAEKAPRRARLALGQVLLVLLANVFGVRGRPVGELLRALRQ